MTNFWCVFHHFRKNSQLGVSNRRQLRWTRSFVLQRILFGHLRICYDTSKDGSEDRHLCCLVLQDAKWYVLHGFISFSWGGWCDQLHDHVNMFLPVVMFSVSFNIFFHWTCTSGVCIFPVHIVITSPQHAIRAGTGPQIVWKATLSIIRPKTMPLL